jgi:hypothetical protein
MVDSQLIPKVNITDEVSRAKASVTVWLPRVALVPAQLSSGPPPVAVQVVASEDVHVSVVDFPAMIVVGDAAIVAVTAGQLTTTEAEACAVSPLVDDVQIIVYVRAEPVAGAKASVSVSLPDVALLPGQSSSLPPPVAEQLVAFEELQVRLTVLPAMIAAEEAEIAAVTGSHVHTTGADTVTAATPGAAQFSVGRTRMTARTAFRNAMDVEQTWGRLSRHKLL